ncbi:LOB domain-containing protein 23-like [Prosopis cineraria]|uniref:LOB domain-containing protein 23-like n=1 Tax=Prosopis cineraria TaxID=364024 RepID=UPI00240FD75F|nr:LOB domain-containing protein 23-like [Prosopis cineraria]
MISSGRCAACRNQRRRCHSNCIFSPYFPANDPQRFAYVHRIYGGSRVGRILQQIPSSRRAEAADALYFEAECRIEDPVCGCVKIISELWQQIHNTEIELARVQALVALHRFQIPQTEVIMPSSQSSTGHLFQINSSTPN